MKYPLLMSGSYFLETSLLHFIALHGVGGEDGKIQSILSKKGIRYTGSGIESCNLTFDKSITKKSLKKMASTHHYLKLFPRVLL